MATPLNTKQLENIIAHAVVISDGEQSSDTIGLGNQIAGMAVKL